MLNDLGALTLLGESADWLKDSQGVSVGDHRLTFMNAFRAAWAEPDSAPLHEALRNAVTPLFAALRHNHLYPDEYLLDPSAESPAAFLPDPANLRRDFDRLRTVVVVNKFGIGETPLLYMTYLLCRMVFLHDTPYDMVVEKKISDVIFLREPIYRADNLGQYSTELKARLHAVRILRCMRAMGLFDDKPVHTLHVEDQAEMREVLCDELCAAAAPYIQVRHHAAFVILDTASALEAYGRAHAASRAPMDERTPDELFLRLRRHVRKLREHADIGPERQQRLVNLAMAAIVRAVAHVETALGQKLYTFLRSSHNKARVRHDRMFELLPNNAERLRFVNFLYLHGKQNPIFYVDRFQKHFGGSRLQFVSKTSGFTLEPGPRTP